MPAELTTMLEALVLAAVEIVWIPAELMVMLDVLVLAAVEMV